MVYSEENLPDKEGVFLLKSLGRTEKGSHRTKDEDTIIFNGDFVFGEEEKWKAQVEEGKEDALGKIVSHLFAGETKEVVLGDLKDRYNELITDGKIQALDLVIDGMGRMGDGEKVSAAISLVLFDKLLSHLKEGEKTIPEAIKTSLIETLTELRQKYDSQLFFSGSGATLALSLIDSLNQAHIINVGDPRVYVLRKDNGQVKEAELMTRDYSHSWGLTTELSRLPYKKPLSAITHAIEIVQHEGNYMTPKGGIDELEVRTVDLNKGDLVVSMCDGVWGGLWGEEETEEKLKKILGEFDEKKWKSFSPEKREDIFVKMWGKALLLYLQEKQVSNPEEIIACLVNNTVAVNSRDNASAVVTEVKKPTGAREVLMRIGSLDSFWKDVEEKTGLDDAKVEGLKELVEQALKNPSSFDLEIIKKRIEKGDCVYHPDWHQAKNYIVDTLLIGFDNPERLSRYYLDRMVRDYANLSDEGELDLPKFLHSLLSYITVKRLRTQKDKLKELK